MAEEVFFEDDEVDFDNSTTDHFIELTESEEKAVRRERFTELRRRIENQLEERRLRDDFGVYDLDDLILD